MNSTSSVTKSNPLNLSVLVWRSGIDRPSYKEALETIAAWWTALSDRHVSWKIVIGPGVHNILAYECCIKQAKLTAETLHYYVQADDICHTIPVKELYLDLEFQELTIVVDSVSDVKYRVQPL